MKFRFWTPLLAGKSANFFFKSTTSELFGVVIVLLGSVNYLNNVQSLKYLSTSLISLKSFCRKSE